MVNIINKRKYFYVFSVILTIASIVCLSLWGLKLGIDFKGGTLMEVQFSEKDAQGNAMQIPSQKDVAEKLSTLALNGLTIQPSEGNSLILRYVASDEFANEQVLEKLKEFDENVSQTKVDFIGSSVSGQIKRNAFMALIFAVVGIALYIAWAFRKVSYPVASIEYGMAAIIALAHDIIITLGVFSILGEFFEIEVGIPFVAALLTILGYSVNDTIVVFDRIRENLFRTKEKNFEKVVDRSLNETVNRSINTSLTVIIVLIAIILFGGESIKYFAVALFIGVGFGTYSSIFVASALLVTSYNYKNK